MEDINKAFCESLEKKLIAQKVIIIVLFVLLFISSGILLFLFLSDRVLIEPNEHQSSSDNLEENTSTNDSENISKEDEMNLETEINEEKIGEEDGLKLPDNYDVEKVECTEQDGSLVTSEDCISVYVLYPKKISDADKEYMSSSYVKVFSKPDNIELFGQIEKTYFRVEDGEWVVFNGQEDTEVLEEKVYGMNHVVFTTSGGSQSLLNHYVISKPTQDLTIVLTIPETTRVRCDLLGGNEKESCLDFFDDLGVEYSDGQYWIPNANYEEVYGELKEHLSDIW